MIVSRFEIFGRRLISSVLMFDNRIIGGGGGAIFRHDVIKRRYSKQEDRISSIIDNFSLRILQREIINYRIARKLGNWIFYLHDRYNTPWKEGF